MVGNSNYEINNVILVRIKWNVLVEFDNWFVVFNLNRIIRIFVKYVILIIFSIILVFLFCIWVINLIFFGLLCNNCSYKNNK